MSCMSSLRELRQFIQLFKQENMLGWILYLISIANVIYTIAVVVTMIFGAALAIFFIAWLSADIDSELWGKIRKVCIITLCIATPLCIFVPSKATCYQIFAVSAATEVIKNSEALQELPEKSFEALNRILDSIAKEEKETEESSKN